jgi:hypothetical protein
LRASSRLAAALLTIAATDASAHRTDDYLQAARIGVEPDRVRITPDLTPGSAVADSFLAALDQDHDGRLSPDEERAYARQVVRALRVQIDGRPLGPRVVSSSVPEPSAFRRGEGVIRLELQAALTGAGAGPHRLLFRNTHLAGHSAYLANALVPTSDRVAVTAQRRDRDQRELTIEYTVRAR